MIEIINWFRLAEGPVETVTERLSRGLAEVVMSKCRSPVVTLFGTSAERDELYRPGNYRAVVASLTNLAVVDEGQLTWDQVFEFRADSESKSAFRRLRHWLDAEMVAKPATFVEMKSRTAWSATIAHLRSMGYRRRSEHSRRRSTESFCWVLRPRRQPQRRRELHGSALLRVQGLSSAASLFTSRTHFSTCSLCFTNATQRSRTSWRFAVGWDSRRMSSNSCRLLGGCSCPGD